MKDSQQHVGGLASVLEADLPDGTDQVLASLSLPPDLKHALYLSVPLTSGRAHLDATARQAARSRNQERAGALAATVAQRFRDRTVINPATLPDVPGWTQPDYHRFWVEVLRRHVDLAVFADDWEFSSGCTLEFVSCVGFGIETLDEEFKPLTPHIGLGLIDRARPVLHEAGHSVTYQLEARRHVERVLS